jgi:glyceraldehyde-3-phosphate dehydrogenase/erythrose-4-phosphate dehydrogenase
VVAINASGDLATNAHLLKYDTTHGRFRTSVETEGENCIIIDGKKIAFYSTKDPKGVNWAATAWTCCSNAPAPTPPRPRPRPCSTRAPSAC